jgi:membrane associated rhomboid family serine protease
MLFVFIVLVVLATLAFRTTTPQDRERFMAEVVQPAAAHLDRVVFAMEPFRAMLRARTPRLVVTPVLAGLYVLMFLAMLFGAGSFGAPSTLIEWGASSGPRTTTGEWWRLFTAIFVTGGFFDLLLVLIGLVQVSELLERLLGAPTVAAVYVAAGVIAGLVSLVDHPLAIHAGGSAAVFGLFGLLLGVSAMGVVPGLGSTVAIPWPIVQSLIPAATLFFLDSLVTDGLAHRPNLTGLVVGFVAGAALTIKVGDRKPARRSLAIAMAIAAAIAVAVAWPLRGIIDVRPDLLALVATEERKDAIFQLTVARFTSRGQPIDRGALVTLIDKTMLPQVQHSRASVGALETSLAVQQPLLATALEYLRLREESWRLRSEGLRKGKVDILREADRLEAASHLVLDKLRAVDLAIEVYT